MGYYIVVNYREDPRVEKKVVKLTENASYSTYKNETPFRDLRVLADFNLENSKNVRFGKFQKFAICKIPRISKVQNSKNYQFGKFEKFAI